MAVPTEIPVLVAGGGPTGLLASTLLGRFGVPNLVIEKHPSTSRYPKACRLNARTMEILRVAGIEPEVRAREADIAELPLLLAGETLGGPVRMRVEGDRRAEMHRYSPTTWAHVPQDVVEPILRAHAESQPASQLCFGMEIIHLHQDPEGVDVELRERSGGRRHRVRAGRVIGADGAHSLVRRSAGIEMSGAEHLSNQLSILFRADLESVRGPNRSVLFQIANDTVRGRFLMIGDGRWVFACADLPDPTPDRCTAIIRAAAGVPDLPVEIIGASRWEAAAAVAQRLRADRVFLAGDAAHRLTPAGALGLNTGAQDVHNLAWKLNATLTGWAGDGLLNSYEAERQPVAQRNVDISRKLWETAPNSAAGWVFGHRYERGALVPDGTELSDLTDRASEYSPNARPGSRAPHWWLADGTSSIDLFDRELVLISEEDDGRWQDAAADAVAAGVPLRAVQRPAAEWAGLCGVEPGGAILVRPDGHVAWRAPRPTAGPHAGAECLRSALDGILCRNRRVVTP